MIATDLLVSDFVWSGKSYWQKSKTSDVLAILQEALTLDWNAPQLIPVAFKVVDIINHVASKFLLVCFHKLKANIYKRMSPKDALNKWTNE